MDIPELIYSDRQLYALLVAVLSLLAVLQRRYSGPDSDWIEDVKRILFVAADETSREHGHALVTKRHPREYVATVEMGPDEIEEVATECGYEEDDVSTEKYRVLPDGERQYQEGQLSYREEGSEKKHHLFLFTGEDEDWSDLYHHKETDWDPTSGGDPEGHMKDGIEPGDPDGVLRDCLDEKDVDHRRYRGWAKELREAFEEHESE